MLHNFSFSCRVNLIRSYSVLGSKRDYQLDGCRCTESRYLLDLSLHITACLCRKNQNTDNIPTALRMLVSEYKYKEIAKRAEEKLGFMFKFIYTKLFD